MEIRRWPIYVIINCVVITHLVAKPVSLNELIAAENKQKQTSQHTKPTVNKKPKTVSLNELIAAESKKKDIKSSSTKPEGVTSKPKTFSRKEGTPSESRQNFEKTRFPKILGKKPKPKTFSLKDLFDKDSRKTSTKRRIESLLSKSPGAGIFSRRNKLFPSLGHKLFESEENIFSLARTISPLQFRKKFEIYTPLKPKKIKYSFTPRLKRRNQSSKREATENEVFSHRYIPLIKRIGLLVDDILSPDSSESFEPPNRRRKQRRNHKSDKTKDDVDLASSESNTQKATVTTSTTVSPTTTDAEDTTSETPDATTYTTPTGDLYTLRPNTDIPLPSTGNTSSDRRDDHGISEGSGPAFHGDIEGHITGNNGSDEYNSNGGKQTYSSSHEKDSCSSTRIGKCDGDGPRNGTNTRHTDIHKTEKTKISSDRFVGRNDTEGKNTFQVGRQEALQIPRDVRLRGHIPDDKVVTVDAESLPAEKSREEGFINVTNDHTSAERRTDRNGAVAPEDQGLREVFQGMIPMNDFLDPNFLKQQTQNHQVVTIFDGYSVARDINGRNKLTEKSIRISPNTPN